MHPISFLEHANVARLSASYDALRRDKAQATYNLFTISSYNSYLENFHSDIIASLLDPTGRHREGATFLHLFLSWLNAVHGTGIDAAQFRHTVVTREQGRLDIWLRDESSRQSIIIENKVNGAEDMDDQIDRYFRHAAGRRYETKAVVYLSLDGVKPAPPCADVPPALIYNAAAYANVPSDLVHGWLRPCYESATREDSRSFIYQYIKLLEHLANKNMDAHLMGDFYRFVSTNGGLQTLKNVSEMAARLPLYRADRFAASITDYAPFKKHGRWKPTYLVYERFWEGGHELKLDVYYESDGSAYLALWNTQVEGGEGRRVIREKLEAIGRLADFVEEPTHWNDNAYGRHFILGSAAYPNLEAVDDAHIAYTKALLSDLKKLQERPPTLDS